MEKRHGVIKIPEERQKDFDIPYTFVNPGFENFDKANEVLEKLKIAIKLFGYVSVAYLYQLTDHDAEYDDTCYGWKDLSKTYIMFCSVNTHIFFICNFPKPIKLN